MARNRADEKEDGDEDDRLPRRVRLPRPRIRVKSIQDMEEHLESLHDKLDAIIVHLEEEEDDDDDDDEDESNSWATKEQKALVAEHVVKPLMIQLSQALAKPDGLAEIFTMMVSKFKEMMMKTKTPGVGE